MKNYNYNLVKLLHCSLDDLWRLEKFYLKDAKACAGCSRALAALYRDMKRHVAALSKELATHSKAGTLN